MGAPGWRPDLQILVYPTIDVTKPEWWPWKASDGFPPPNDSTHLHITNSTPAAFLVASTKDRISSDSENTVPYSKSLHAAGVPFESFVRDMGDHGFTLCGGW